MAEDDPKFRAALAKGLGMAIYDLEPIIAGEEWSVLSTLSTDVDIEVDLEDEQGCTYTCILRVVEAWED